MTSPDRETAPTSAEISTLPPNPCPGFPSLLPLLLPPPGLPLSTLPQLILSSFPAFSRLLFLTATPTQSNLPKIPRIPNNRTTVHPPPTPDRNCPSGPRHQVAPRWWGVVCGGRGGALTNRGARPLTPQVRDHLHHLPPRPAPGKAWA